MNDSHPSWTSSRGPVMIIDCLRPILDALGLDEHRDAGRFLVAFDALLAKPSSATRLLIQHMGHANERARGDSRLQDWPDAIWRLVREDDDPASPRYFTAYGRDVDVARRPAELRPVTRRMTYTAGSRHTVKVDEAVIAIIKLLAECAKDGDDGLSGRAIETALAGEQPRDTVREALKKALARRRRHPAHRRQERSAQRQAAPHLCTRAVDADCRYSTAVRGTNPARQRSAACSMNNPVRECAGVRGSALAHSSVCAVSECAARVYRSAHSPHTHAPSNPHLKNSASTRTARLSEASP